MGPPLLDVGVGAEGIAPHPALGSPQPLPERILTFLCFLCERCHLTLAHLPAERLNAPLGRVAPGTGTVGNDVLDRPVQRTGQSAH